MSAIVKECLASTDANEIRAPVVGTLYVFAQHDREGRKQAQTCLIAATEQIEWDSFVVTQVKQEKRCFDCWWPPEIQQSSLQ